ncbi:hypothetical protein COB52_03350 [Candidatus Kaiserbacteria bacterium]|nr:MAG: hypothetical protein COB52_03350 [Candidatus Kaiserbacteria bacterium]
MPKLTKDLLYVLKGGSWLSVSQIAASLQSFLILFLIANFAAPDVLGEYRLVISLVAIFGIFALPGMQIAIMESTPKGFTGNLLTGVLAKLRYGIIGSILALILSAYYASIGNASLSIIMIFVALAAPLLETSALYTFYLYSRKLFKSATLYSIQAKLAALVIGGVAILLFPENIVIIIVALIGTPIVINLLFTYRVNRSAVGSVDPGLISYSKHLSVMAGLLVLATYIDSIFVWHFLGATQLAVFFIAIAIPMELLRAAGMFPILAYPKFATENPSEIKRTLPKLIYKTFIITSAIVLIYILLAPFVFSFLFPQYSESVIYTQVISLILLQVPFLLIKTFFQTQKAVKILYVYGFVFPAIRILLSLALVIQFGLWGIITAILLEALLRTVFSVTVITLYKTEEPSEVSS